VGSNPIGFFVSLSLGGEKSDGIFDPLAGNPTLDALEEIDFDIWGASGSDAMEFDEVDSVPNFENGSLNDFTGLSMSKIERSVATGSDRVGVLK